MAHSSTVTQNASGQACEFGRPSVKRAWVSWFSQSKRQGHTLIWQTHPLAVCLVPFIGHLEGFFRKPSKCCVLPLYILVWIMVGPLPSPTLAGNDDSGNNVADSHAYGCKTT